MTPEQLAVCGQASVVSNVPRVQSVLRLSPCFSVHCTHPKPAAWFRFWYWVLLGWTWEDV